MVLHLIPPLHPRRSNHLARPAHLPALQNPPTGTPQKGHPMNSTEQLHHRAQLAVLVASSATIAQSHLNKALQLATEGRHDIAVIDDLNKSIAATERAIKHAEQCRQRLLRKADRKEQAHA
ncbi:hypothetical protein PY254_10485 [Rhodanobacter sp. AS-Z3]|uniref:hypothetical protein n=1 Tax=Rhodanobacter sp. AS-Z3 TaxID=3031330 RepID=UPI0024795501|nr:hypothetical protein [Rhodanobacter sp. AS-Z3]WEN13673.1 hypothetical protein PY254_10485 [Rhodanobacter sp. AS-Z3]